MYYNLLENIPGFDGYIILFREDQMKNIFIAIFIWLISILEKGEYFRGKQKEKVALWGWKYVRDAMKTI